VASGVFLQCRSDLNLNCTSCCLLLFVAELPYPKSDSRSTSESLNVLNGFDEDVETHRFSISFGGWRMGGGCSEERL